ncbi:hypothetical protein GHT06_010330 [Daphnia sinensis]|uniref:Uncharacterized protein n=1 Tax=Daphnia sinensis TaxID=1820382 RepID=A0AAD5Q116_9CRUS|nr:hypothetical protein GHT06_010330 [Daphnia sinensis]
MGDTCSLLYCTSSTTEWGEGGKGEWDPGVRCPEESERRAVKTAVRRKKEEKGPNFRVSIVYFRSTNR